MLSSSRQVSLYPLKSCKNLRVGARLRRIQSRNNRPREINELIALDLECPTQFVPLSPHEQILSGLAGAVSDCPTTKLSN